MNINLGNQIQNLNINSIPQFQQKQALINLTKEKAILIFEIIIKKLKNNKNKLILSSLLFGVFFIFYKKYISSKIESAMEIYKTISECKELFSENFSNNSFDKILNQYEPCFNNLSKKLLVEIKYKLNSFPNSNLEDLYNKVKNSKREDMLINWTNLKNKVILFYFLSTILSRFVILISQSHLLILEKMQIDNQKIPKNICDDLLTDLWILITNYLNNLIENIDEIIGEEIISIQISSQFSWDSYIVKINNLKDKILLLDLSFDNHDFNTEIKLKLFKNYVSDIAGKINLLESNNFNLDNTSQKIGVFLKFYQIYYDVLNSNLFHVILLKTINNDFLILEKEIKKGIEVIVKEEMQQMQNLLNKNISMSEETEKNIDSNKSNLKININNINNINNNSEVDYEKENSAISIPVSVYDNEINNFKVKLIKILIIMLKINGNILDSNSSFLINKDLNIDKKFNEELVEYFKIIYD
jgi:hypothetical protein